MITLCFLTQQLEISQFYRCHKFLFLTKPSIQRSKSMRWTPDSQTAKFAVLTADVLGHPLMYQGRKLDTKMRSRSLKGAMIAFASLLLVPFSRGQEPTSAPPSNDAIVHHMEELEQQVKDLRAEVAALKDKGSDKSTSPPAAGRAKQLASQLRVNAGHRACIASVSRRIVGADQPERICGRVLRPEFQQSRVTDKRVALLRWRRESVWTEHG